MIIPIRCYSCGKLIGNRWEMYIHLLQQEDKSEKQVLDELGFNRFCCRRMMLTHVDLIEKVMNYNIYEKRGLQGIQQAQAPVEDGGEMDVQM
mmetsp:Transcript_10494/g.15730  ORF Transcript_10494/g.15730 Transcript_10494/m.15730 type:complete len:92 (+) Transcript_10494:165-440(+)|eukprot:CAMPEP_0194769284 /NCGR_PEP_ID=MMETSP0323_2-20130528/42479_1 /TAXON_ID=2866 ORGANISM="Crypthecodinium cohnii, Strain Seligo" /NCGR_SAMPLE_ID=MMETSP0323_2 /ASSEMBLY_ACC=CAM_ASM_000346 /LENGTH=91 /DNA_ID=CAMNT_0039702147 /DNA_START=81 /DNA_END=356 /DNA_ORIENTATION=-